MKTFVVKCLMSLFILSGADAEEITVGLGNFQPYFSDNANSGLFTEIIDKTFALMPDYEANYVFNLPNAKLVHALNENQIDGAANIFTQQQIVGCLTQPVFRYLDMAVSKQNRGLAVNRIDDLLGYSLAAYQGATELLGTRFKLISSGAKAYQEVSEPVMQAKLLSSELVDISIGDAFIFLHSLQKWSDSQLEPEDYRFHQLFPPVQSYMGFNQQHHCDAFNLAFTSLAESGELKNIYRAHLKRLGALPKQLSLSYLEN